MPFRSKHFDSFLRLLLVSTPEACCVALAPILQDDAVGAPTPPSAVTPWQKKKAPSPTHLLLLLVVGGRHCVLRATPATTQLGQVL